MDEKKTITTEKNEEINPSEIVSTIPVGDGKLLVLVSKDDGTLEEHKVDAVDYHLAKGQLI